MDIAYGIDRSYGCGICYGLNADRVDARIKGLHSHRYAGVYFVGTEGLGGGDGSASGKRESAGHYVASLRYAASFRGKVAVSAVAHHDNHKALRHYDSGAGGGFDGGGKGACRRVPNDIEFGGRRNDNSPRPGKQARQVEGHAARFICCRVSRRERVGA